MIVSTFYKYARISDSENLRKKHKEFCYKIGIRGKILVSEEGINGAISGEENQIQTYKSYLKKDALFKNVKFKDTLAEAHPYKKMMVRVREEIVTFKQKVDPKNAAERISPKTLKKWIEKEKIILLDARNNYESRIGKFRNAITPDISTFREFPKVLKQLENCKDQKIVTYCTGGIRCEKASALLKENGFSSVYQLEDGILNYIRQFPDDHFEGRCFVFDSRLSVHSGTKNKEITACELCHAPCGDYSNCVNVKCDKMFVCCGFCRDKMGNACSKRCKNVKS